MLEPKKTKKHKSPASEPNTAVGNRPLTEISEKNMTSWGNLCPRTSPVYTRNRSKNGSWSGGYKEEPIFSGIKIYNY